MIYIKNQLILKMIFFTICKYHIDDKKFDPKKLLISLSNNNICINYNDGVNIFEARILYGKFIYKTDIVKECKSFDEFLDVQNIPREKFHLFKKVPLSEKQLKEQETEYAKISETDNTQTLGEDFDPLS